MMNDLYFISDQLPGQNMFSNNGDIKNETQNLNLLIDWVNSFNDPYCLLVNGVEDLRDGK